jgi:hypothetical protein
VVASAERRRLGRRRLTRFPHVARELAWRRCIAAAFPRQLGRELSDWSGPVETALLGWAQSFAGERLWALEDCPHVSRGLERLLLVAGEPLVRGTSDALDALAIARAALREPRLDHPRAGEERLRELKLLLDHRGDLLAERRRAQQRLRWHLHELDPSLTVPPAALDRGLWLERLGRWLARRQQTTQVRIARELVTRCRSLSRSIAELEAELQARAETLAPRLLELPGCGPLSAAKLLKRDRPDRALSKRRPARSPGRRRSARGQLWEAAATPARPWRQPAAELRPAPDRRHPRPCLRTGPRPPGAQAKRGQEPR